MGLRFDTNVPALNASRVLNRSGQALIQALRRLSRRLRINRAADDAEGLGVAVDFISHGRGSQIDACRNRIEFTIDTLATQRENSMAAESAIRAAGIAAETIAFTHSEILVSAGSSVWAQANVIPQTALTPLGLCET